MCRVLFALPLVAIGEEQPNVVREFKGSTLVEISRDGKWLLTSSRRHSKCADGKDRCYSNILTVSDAATGKTIGELASKRNSADPKDMEAGQFLAPGFIEGRKIGTVELTWDAHQEWVVWEPISGLEERAPLELPKGFGYSCPIDGQHLLGFGPQEIWPPYVPFERNGQILVNMNDPANRVPHHASRSLQIIQVGSAKRDIAVLTDSPLRWDLKCVALRRGTSYLLEDSEVGGIHQDANLGKSLTWFSLDPDTSPHLCRAFEGERIHGYAISPDRSLIAVVASLGEAPNYSVFLDLLDARDCSEMHRFELEFPEKPTTRSPLLGQKFIDNIPFVEQFARLVSISPDNTKLALAYGIQRDPNGFAFFGLYSLTDGHRLATLSGDVYRTNLLKALFNDELHVQWAPINGSLQFSADSKYLYATSQHLRQWDISKLR